MCFNPTDKRSVTISWTSSLQDSIFRITGTHTWANYRWARRKAYLITGFALRPEPLLDEPVNGLISKARNFCIKR